MLANPARVTRSLSRSSSPTASDVTLANLGTVRGDVWGPVVRFLEIPFAAPPVGRLRWRPPQPPIPWEGVRCNPGRLTQCPQVEVGLLQGKFQGRRVEDNEDCLFLNVFAPIKAPQPPPAASATPSSSPRCPVIVYIHGGAGKFGTAHCDDQAGDALAGRGIVYVALNYRLGIFGFLAHPALSLEDDEMERQAMAGGLGTEDRPLPPRGCGNYAILDLIAGLRWVQTHIASFGGDPSNVTIWGLSSGAQFVSTLLVCPHAAGLFHRAFVQSCCDLGNIRKLTSSSDTWRGRSAEDWGVELGRALGCLDESDAAAAADAAAAEGTAEGEEGSLGESESGGGNGGKRGRVDEEPTRRMKRQHSASSLIEQWPRRPSALPRSSSAESVGTVAATETLAASKAHPPLHHVPAPEHPAPQSLRLPHHHHQQQQTPTLRTWESSSSAASSADTGSTNSAASPPVVAATSAPAPPLPAISQVSAAPSSQPPPSVAAPLAGVECAPDGGAAPVTYPSQPSPPPLTSSTQEPRPEPAATPRPPLDAKQLVQLRQLERMRRLSSKRLATASINLPEAIEMYESATDSTRRNALKPDGSLVALESGRFHRVPLLLGYTEDDGLGATELEQIHFDEDTIKDGPALHALLWREFGERAADASRHFCDVGEAREASRLYGRVSTCLGNFSKDIWCASAAPFSILHPFPPTSPPPSARAAHDSPNTL